MFCPEFLDLVLVKGLGGLGSSLSKSFSYLFPFRMGRPLLAFSEGVNRLATVSGVAFLAKSAVAASMTSTYQRDFDKKNMHLFILMWGCRLRRKMTQHTIMSGSHRNLAVILMAMGIWHENEAVVEDGQFSVDIKLEGIPEKVRHNEGPCMQPMTGLICNPPFLQHVMFASKLVPFASKPNISCNSDALCLREAFFPWEQRAELPQSSSKNHGALWGQHQGHLVVLASRRSCNATGHAPL